MRLLRGAQVVEGAIQTVGGSRLWGRGYGLFLRLVGVRDTVAIYGRRSHRWLRGAAGTYKKQRGDGSGDYDSCFHRGWFLMRAFDGGMFRLGGFDEV